MAGLSDEHKQLIRELKNSGILPTVETMIKRRTAPFYWYDIRLPRGSQTLYTATVGFLHTGSRLIGISAEHVHRECAEALDQAPESIFSQIGGARFDPRDRVIDIDRRLDLVTYDLSEIEVNTANADIHYPRSWPPSARENELVIVGGWISEFTQEHEDSSTNSFLHVFARCDNFTEHQIGVAIYPSTSVAWGDSALAAGTELGGLSGGPVFVVREEPLTEVYQVGVIFEYQPSYEIILARPLSLVGPEGEILS